MNRTLTRVVAIPDSKRRGTDHTVFRELHTGRIALPKYIDDENDRFIVIGEVWKAIIHVKNRNYIFVEPTKLEPPDSVSFGFSFDSRKPPTPAITFEWKTGWWLCKNCTDGFISSRAFYTPILIAMKPNSECFLTHDGLLKVWWKGIHHEVSLDGPTELLEYFVEKFHYYKGGANAS